MNTKEREEMEHTNRLDGTCPACAFGGATVGSGCLHAGREIRGGRSGISSVEGMEAMNAEATGGTSSIGAYSLQQRRLTSVLQDWVTVLPLREQGTLLTAVRGCDDEPKQWSRTGVAYSPGRRLTAYIRWCFMNPADVREVDFEEGAFLRSEPPTPFKPSEFGHLPLHWYTHAMHALEIVGYRHPDILVRGTAAALYASMVKGLHLNIETRDEMIERLSEDRIISGTVVS